MWRSSQCTTFSALWTPSTPPKARPHPLRPCPPSSYPRVRLIRSTGVVLGLYLHNIKVLYAKRTGFVACLSPKSNASRLLSVSRPGSSQRPGGEAGRGGGRGRPLELGRARRLRGPLVGVRPHYGSSTRHNTAHYHPLFSNKTSLLCFVLLCYFDFN